MVLNMAQTWHQVRPGEKRVDCGGCHAHSQEPTRFEETAAARADYELFDLTRSTPLLTAKANDRSGKQWDAAGESGLRYEQGPHDVEYWRDVQPIFARSCVACHTKEWQEPAAGLVLDDETPTSVHGVPQTLPASYARLAADPQAIFGPKPLLARSQHHGWQQYLLSDNASRYICKLQSRRSLLVWKIYGERLDGWTNDDVPSEEINPGDRGSRNSPGATSRCRRSNTTCSKGTSTTSAAKCPPGPRWKERIAGPTESRSRWPR
jgi:hypothetical protein